MLMMRKANPKRFPSLPRPRMCQRKTQRRERERAGEERTRMRMEMGMNARRVTKGRR